jgi:hypothetical protein
MDSGMNTYKIVYKDGGTREIRCSFATMPNHESPLIQFYKVDADLGSVIFAVHPDSIMSFERIQDEEIDLR